MQLISVSSSNVSQIGYENGILEVHFHSGHVYQYLHVPEAYLDYFFLLHLKANLFISI